MTENIVERIYEAAAVPELWPGLFHDISLRHGFVGGGMFSNNPQFDRGVVSEPVAEVFDRFIKDGWRDRNCRAPRVAALRHEGFVRDQDILTDGEIATEPMYVQLLRPHGLGYGAGSVVNAPGDDVVVFTFERAEKLGPTPVEVVRELDLLRPHLARAAVFAGRLDLERSRAQVQALAALGLPAAALSVTGAALAANAEFEALGEQIEIGARDLIRLTYEAGDRLLKETLDRPRDRHGAPAGRSMPLPASGDARAGVLHLLPIRRAALDIFSPAAWLAVVTQVGRSAAPSATILSGLFDLTPAEARVARQLIEGRSVAEIAETASLSDSTIRNQLRAVFLKTGVSRQSELVRMCGGLGLSDL